MQNVYILIDRQTSLVYGVFTTRQAAEEAMFKEKIVTLRITCEPILK